jgi:hypothetical protein
MSRVSSLSCAYNRRLSRTSCFQPTVKSASAILHYGRPYAGCALVLASVRYLTNPRGSTDRHICIAGSDHGLRILGNGLLVLGNTPEQRCASSRNPATDAAAASACERAKVHHLTRGNLREMSPPLPEAQRAAARRADTARPGKPYAAKRDCPSGRARAEGEGRRGEQAPALDLTDRVFEGSRRKGMQRG